MKGKSKKNTLCQLSLVQLIRFKISTLPPDFAKCYQVCLFFQPIRFVPQTGFHIQHRPTKYFSNLAKVLHIFSALLFVFQNIFKWILFIGCQSFLCPIVLEVLCWFWGKILRLNLLYISTRLKEFPPFPNIMYIYVVHALRACHCKSKADLCLYSYINSRYSIFTVIQ